MAEEQDRPFDVDSQLAERKMERWGSNDNFVAPRELTVTITLGEYRQLIEDKTRYSSQACEARELAESRLKEVQARAIRIAELESQVAELQQKLTKQI